MCDKAIYGTISSSLLFVGWILGALVGGVLADKFGRKIMVFLFGFMIALFSLLSAFPNTYWLFAVFRFIVGVAIGIYSTDSVSYGILFAFNCMTVIIVESNHTREEEEGTGRGGRHAMKARLSAKFL